LANYNNLSTEDQSCTLPESIIVLSDRKLLISLFLKKMQLDGGEEVGLTHLQGLQLRLIIKIGIRI